MIGAGQGKPAALMRTEVLAVLFQAGAQVVPSASMSITLMVADNDGRGELENK